MFRIQVSVIYQLFANIISYCLNKRYIILMNKTDITNHELTGKDHR